MWKYWGAVNGHGKMAVYKKMKRYQQLIFAKEIFSYRREMCSLKSGLAE
jgi:hypothetical protein